MKFEQRFLAMLTLITSTACAPLADAAMPVIDAANLSRAVQQVMAWARQYGQMAQELQNQIQQITQLQNTFQALTGDRGFGNLMNGAADQLARRYLPDDMAQLYTLYTGSIVPGFSALTSRIQGLRSTLSSYPPGYFPAGSELETQLYRTLDALGAQHVMAEEAYRAVGNRTITTENLMATIPFATDPAAIAQLQARIQAEQILAQNESNRFALMAYQQEAQRREEDRRSLEDIARASRAGAGGITFSSVGIAR